MTGIAPQRPMIIGHRGARGELPENTLEGIHHAFSVGCDMVEIDVRLTKEGEAVVVHDATLNPDLTRTAEGKWIESGLEISTLTASALSGYDIGRVRPDSATARRFPEQAALHCARIPMLPEALALARRARKCLLIELKNDPNSDPDGKLAAALSARIATDVKAAGLEDRVVVQSFDWRVLRHLRCMLPGTQLSALSCKKDNDAPGNVFPGSPWLDGYADIASDSGVSFAVAAAGCNYWAPNAADLTSQDLSDAQDMGVRVLAWTVNDPEKIDQNRDANVFGIITDVPTLAQSRVAMPAFRPARTPTLGSLEPPAPSPGTRR